jgi:hypothetical protein
VWARFAIAALILIPALAEAAPYYRKIVVLVSVPERLDSEAFNAVAMRERVEAMIEFYPKLSLQKKARIDLTNTLRECGSKTPCIAQNLRAKLVDYALLIAANGATNVLTSRLLDAGTAEVLGQKIEITMPLQADDVLEAQVEALLAAQGYEAGGRLIVEIFPLDAHISINAEQPVVGPIHPRLLPAGLHRLVAQREGYERLEMEIGLQPYREETVALRMENAKPSSFLSSPWFWAGVGVVCIGAGVGVTLALTGGDPSGP